MQRYIDHTLLKADAKTADIKKLCSEAKEHSFFSVCVNSCHVPLCKHELLDTGVKVCSVVGFPLGAMSTAAKAFETQVAVENGADEIDMVINIGAAKDNRWEFVTEDIAAVVRAANGKTVKVILETSLLTDDEKMKVCECALKANAHFVKTSTGFGGGGATVEDIKLMKSIVGDKMSVKASGGVRDQDTARAMIAAGATRLGTSSGVALVAGQKIDKGSY